MRILDAVLSSTDLGGNIPKTGGFLMYILPCGSDAQVSLAWQWCASWFGLAVVCESVWPGSKVLVWEADIDIGLVPCFTPFSSKGCGLWALSRDFAPQLMKH